MQGNKRVRLTFPAQLHKALVKLASDWGLDFNGVVTHCCARIVNYERERKEMLARGRSLALESFEQSIDAERNQK